MRRASDPLLHGLVDDAALFPPGNAPMDVALAEHARHRGAPWADAVGPFLCPASRVEELRARLPADATLRLVAGLRRRRRRRARGAAGLSPPTTG